MANRAYVRFWIGEDSSAIPQDGMRLHVARPAEASHRETAQRESRQSRQRKTLEYFERFLETVPLSPQRPGFSSLVIRAIGPAETPLIEHDLRGVPCSASDVIELVRPYSGLTPESSDDQSEEASEDPSNGLSERSSHDLSSDLADEPFGGADIACEVGAYWDVWQLSPDTGLWQQGPEPILLTYQGEEYDDGTAAESGHFLADLGLEDIFTGHGGVLGSRGGRSAPSDPVEAEFLALMLHEEHLHEYYEKTRQNIQMLLRWVRTVEEALPVERFQLWSEGEENFEARLDEILAVR